MYLTYVQNKYYSWGHRFGSHGCRIEALFQFSQFITPDQEELLQENFHGVKAVWGGTGVGKSALVRFYYYLIMAYSLKLIEETELVRRGLLPEDSRHSLTGFERFGWVDVPEPFDLAEFSRRLLLDFNSYDPGEMEKTAVGIIQGHNPIQQCYETIRKQKCLVVIDGLRSTRDWDSIKQAFWGHHHKHSCIYVITIDESVAQHCLNNSNNVINYGRTIPMRALDDNSALDLFKKVCLLTTVLPNTSRYIYYLPTSSSTSNPN